MASPARTVILETVAQQAVDSACDKWEDAARAWMAIEWALARDPHVGVPLTEGGNVRGLLYDGARSIGQPDVEVIYEIQQNAIIVRSAIFKDAKASFAGAG
jgi:hypothetical protein